MMKDVLGQEITPGCVVAHCAIKQGHEAMVNVCIVRDVDSEKGGIRAGHLGARFSLLWRV